MFCHVEFSLMAPTLPMTCFCPMARLPVSMAAGPVSIAASLAKVGRKNKIPHSGRLKGSHSSTSKSW